MINVAAINFDKRVAVLGDSRILRSMDNSIMVHITTNTIMSNCNINREYSYLSCGNELYLWRKVVKGWWLCHGKGIGFERTKLAQGMSMEREITITTKVAYDEEKAIIALIFRKKEFNEISKFLQWIEE